MTGEAPPQGSNVIFWIALVPLLIGVVGTIVIVVGSHLRGGAPVILASGLPEAKPSAAATVDPRVTLDGARICVAFRALRHGNDLVPDAALWKQLGVAAAPLDPWGLPYQWEPWSRAVRSFGPDKTRGSPDDQLFPCD